MFILGTLYSIQLTNDMFDMRRNSEEGKLTFITIQGCVFFILPKKTNKGEKERIKGRKGKIEFSQGGGTKYSIHTNYTSLHYIPLYGSWIRIVKNDGSMCIKFHISLPSEYQAGKNIKCQRVGKGRNWEGACLKKQYKEVKKREGEE